MRDARDASHRGEEWRVLRDVRSLVGCVFREEQKQESFVLKCVAPPKRSRNAHSGVQDQHSLTRGARWMRACLLCAAAAVPARRAHTHIKPWHAARGAGGSAAARVSSGAMSAAGVSGDSSRDAPVSPSRRAATPMRGLTGENHPSVNLPPLPLPTRAEGGEGSRVASGEDGFLVVGRDFNRARFDPVANSKFMHCLLYTSPSPRDYAASRMPSSA